MTNSELYMIAGRVAALEGYFENKRRRTENNDPIIFADEVEAILGIGKHGMSKCGHPADDDAAEYAARRAERHILPD